MNLMTKLVVVSSVVSMVSLAAFAGTGNGAPSGAHFNLNIIGSKTAKSSVDMTTGNRIFVLLGTKDTTKTTTINLSEGPFAVLDANGTDGKAAFQLPSPDLDNDGVTSYSVYLRVLGKPNGKVQIATAATDPFDGSQVVSDRSVVAVRTKGGQKFTNVSEELLYIYGNVWDVATQTYIYQRIPLFSPLLQDYLWIYDNNGAKLVQLRFYDVPTTVPAP